MFALLCMGVCGVRGLEGGDVRTSVCCMGLKLMPYVIIMKENIYIYIYIYIKNMSKRYV